MPFSTDGVAYQLKEESIVDINGYHLTTSYGLCVVYSRTECNYWLGGQPSPVVTNLSSIKRCFVRSFADIDPDPSYSISLIGDDDVVVLISVNSAGEQEILKTLYIPDAIKVIETSTRTYIQTKHVVYGISSDFKSYEIMSGVKLIDISRDGSILARYKDGVLEVKHNNNLLLERYIDHIIKLLVVPTKSISNESQEGSSVVAYTRDKMYVWILGEYQLEHEYDISIKKIQASDKVYVHTATGVYYIDNDRLIQLMKS